MMKKLKKNCLSHAFLSLFFIPQMFWLMIFKIRLYNFQLQFCLYKAVIGWSGFS